MMCGKFDKNNNRSRWTLDNGFGRITADDWGSNLLTNLTTLPTNRQSASMVSFCGK